MNDARPHIDDTTKNNVKDHLLEFVAAHLQPSGQKTKDPKRQAYVCPICRSGTGINGHKTGAFHVNPVNTQLWKCFACNAAGDIFTLFHEMYGLDYAEAMTAAVEDYERRDLKRDIPTVASVNQKPVEPAKTPAEIRSEADMHEAALRGSAGEQYLLKRGIDLSTQTRFHLGYDAAKRAVVIPYSPAKTYYTERRINPRDHERRHFNLNGVPVPLFNRAALWSGEENIFVTEAPLDAISIMCAGGTAVALSGTAPEKLVKALQERPCQANMLICLDNDEAGRKATDAICEALNALGIEAYDVSSAIMTSAYDEVERIARKDPNEVLQYDGVDVLRNRIEQTIRSMI